MDYRILRKTEIGMASIEKEEDKKTEQKKWIEEEFFIVNK